MSSLKLIPVLAGPTPVQQPQMAGQQGQMAGQQGQMAGQQGQMGGHQGQMAGQQGQMAGQQGQMAGQKGQLGMQQGQMGQAQMAGPDPMWTTCPNCKTEIVTKTRKSMSTFQCLVATCFCFFCPCCFCIPFCKGDWKDVLHTCPKCNFAIGKYKK